MASIEFLPPISLPTAGLMLAVCVLAYALIRTLAGPPASISRRRVLLGLRTAVIGVLLMLLWNPVSVTETPGTVERPELFYLVDASASMQMGGESSRWSDALRMMRDADRQTAGVSGAAVSLFRFGQRLSAIDSAQQVGLEHVGAEDSRRQQKGTDVAKADPPRPENLPKVEPVDSDSRLLEALRQVSSRFGRRPPAGLVVYSDGQVRDPDAVRELAKSFAGLNVPIHVAPVGNMSGDGDIAIAGVVAPRRVRKYSDVDVQAFVRSYGYDGVTTEVRLLAVDPDGTERVLNSAPVSLRSGFQPVSLTFRSELGTRELKISVAPRAGELATNNNEFLTTIDVDRTKIRVLYLEGSRQPVQQVRRGNQYSARGPYSDLKEALTKDPDIECVVISAPGGNAVRVVESSQSASRGFPVTLAELSAFDAIIFSDVSRDAVTDEQIGWVEHWVSERGGGLCMTGGEYSFASGGWADTKLADALPVRMIAGDNAWNANASVRVSADETRHPIWRILEDEQQRRNALAAFPSFTGIQSGLELKPNIATQLASTSDITITARQTSFVSSLLSGFSGRSASETRLMDSVRTAPLPVIAVGRYGSGRTMAVAAAITAPWANEFINNWGTADSDYYGRFWRNAVYWLTENSSIGRRRLVVQADKRYYKPGDKLTLRAVTFDENSNPTQNYRVATMVEPQQFLNDDSFYSPIRWPARLTRTSGEEGPFVAWGEEFDLPKRSGDTDAGGFAIELDIADAVESGSSSQALRFELTAYEDYTQVDSTSMDVQILHDPFEQQNPFPDFELLEDVARASGGRVLAGPQSLADLIGELPVAIGPPEVRRQPLWSQWWLLLVLLGLLTTEWFWRRRVGLA
ncbi:MAG: glutamine amidotransferase [Planctomycetaceae bacterium]